jgi:T5SS/PEP-CTERM-associated repeat protein
MLAAAGQPAALGSILSWNNPAGGSAAVTTNWNPTLLPGSADDLTYGLAASYAVSFGATTTASRTITFRQGTVTLTTSSPHTVSTGITVGDLNGDVATATLTTGTMQSTATVIVGDALGSSGTLNVNDDDADLLINGAGADLFVGSNGDGAMTIDAGGLVQVADQLIVGNNAGSSPTLTVHAVAGGLPVVRSHLSVLGTSQSRLGQGGDATISVLNGALADFAGSVVVANGIASTSSVTVAGTGGILNTRATLDVAGDLMLGRNSNAGTPAGVATFNVNGGGTVSVGGTLFVASDPDGGTATLHTEGDGAITSHSLTIGGGAILDLDDGTVDIDGGTFTWSIPGVPAAINGGAGRPVVTLRNGATATFSRVSPGGQVLTVGGGTGANFADFDVRSGADLILTDGIATIGAGADDEGSVIINGVGSTMTMDPAGSALVVGDAGNGRLEAELGGVVTGDNLFVATDAGSAGLALFENLGTVATFNDIYVGGNTGVAGGAGVLIVNDRAVLNMPGAAGIIRIYPGNTLDVSGGIVNAGGKSAVIDGQLILEDAGAELHAGSVVVSSGGRIIGHPDVAGNALLDAEVLLSSGASLDLVFGDVAAGDPTSTSGFFAAPSSTINIRDNVLTLLDADEAEIDTVTIAGGTLAAPDSDGIKVLINGSIDGEGTITTPTLFFDSGGGVITATGAGITINGLLRNNSGTIDGTKFTFNGPDGGWTGAGTINARAVFNSGAEVNALANMTIGLNVFDGVTFNAGSELHADNRTVRLVDSNGIGLPTVTDVNTDGSVVCAQNLVVNSGRRVSGRGTIDTPLLTVFGRIAPGELVGVAQGETGILGVSGGLTIGAAAFTDIEIGGLTPPLEFDRIVATGAVTLGGTLNVGFLNTGVASTPFQLMIIGAPSISGSFATLNLPAGCRIVQTATAVTLVSCPADFNSSGTLSVQDIFDFLAAYFGGDPRADFNHSGAISVQDIFDFLAAYFAGCA